MKCVIVQSTGTPGGIVFGERPAPEPAGDELLIDVEAIDTNYPDILVSEGRYQVRPPVPFIPGKAASGRVAAIGSAVSGWTIGQRVAAQVEYGAYAETLCAPARHCYPVPDGIGAVDAAAALLAYQTAWFALTDRARMASGESVLVLGASGGVGTASLQLASALGAGRVIAASRGAAKADVLWSCGADAVIDASGPELEQGLRERVRQCNDGKGVDIVVDPVGGDLFAAALRCLTWRGRHVVIGFAGGGIPVARANYLLLKNISVCGLQASDYRDRWPDEAAAAQAAIFGFMAAGQFTPMIDAVLPLRDYARVFDRLRNGSVRGKVVLTTDRLAS